MGKITNALKNRLSEIGGTPHDKGGSSTIKEQLKAIALAQEAEVDPKDDVPALIEKVALVEEEG